jgi:MFS family permease
MQPSTKRSEPIVSVTVFLIALLFIEFFWFMGTKISEMLLDLQLQDFSGDVTTIYAQIQVADSFFNFVTAGAVLLWGIIVDRYPVYRKFCLMIANGIWIFANFILYFSPASFSMYLFVQICYGIAMGANGPIIYSYLGDLFAIEYRGRLFSLFNTILYLIKGSTVALNGIIGQWMSSWKFPNFLMAIGGLIMIILLIRIREPQLAQVEPEFSSKIAAGISYKYRIQLADLKSIIKQPTNLLFLLQGIFGMSGVVIVTRYLSYWLTSTYYDGMGMNNTLAVLLLGIGGGIGALLGINIAGWWADTQFKQGRLDRMLYFSITCVFGQVGGYALLVFIPTYPSAVDSSISNPIMLFQTYPVFLVFVLIFNLCLFCGTGIGSVVNMVRTHINLPEHRGTAAALYDSFDSIGAAIALLVGSQISHVLQSARLTIFIGSLMWLISGLIWLRITKTITHDYQIIRGLLEKRALE